MSETDRVAGPEGAVLIRPALGDQPETGADAALGRSLGQLGDVKGRFAEIEQRYIGRGKLPEALSQPLDKEGIDAWSRALLKAGMRIAISRAMIAMTTSNSISVNARHGFRPRVRLPTVFTSLIFSSSH